MDNKKFYAHLERLIADAIEKAVAEKQAEIDRLKELNAETASGLRMSLGEIDRLKAELERVRMVVVKWNGFCTSSRLVEETEACISGWNRRASDAITERDTARQQLKECWEELTRGREVLRQLSSLANVNQETRAMLYKLGNSFNAILERQKEKSI